MSTRSLTNEQVRAIRQARAENEATQAELAERYGVSERTVRAIEKRERYAGVPDDPEEEEQPQLGGLQADAGPEVPEPDSVFQETHDGSEEAIAYSTDPTVKTLEDLIEACEIDTDVWMATDVFPNSWTTPMKIDGSVRHVSNYQIKAHFRKRPEASDIIPAAKTIHVPARKFDRVRRSSKGTLTQVAFSDEHFPHHDERALNILYQVMELTRPRLVTALGDGPDCEEISKYPKDPHGRTPLTEELDMVSQHLGIAASLAHPDHEGYYCEGNHGERIRRKVWELAQDRTAGELMTLPGVSDALRLEKLIGVEDLGWEFVPYPDHRVLFDRLIIKHGSTVRQDSGSSAKAEYKKYGKSGISGHTHRRGVYEHRDYNGFHGWWEIGMLGQIRHDYVDYADWQQGFVVITWSKDRKHFNVEEVRIHDGVAMFRGEKLVADSKSFGDLARVS